MIKVRIHVTQDDIDLGHPCDNFTCPIAIAAFRIIPCRWMHIQVSMKHLGIRFGRNIDLPPEARRFIRDFDNREPASPFSFVVEI